MAQNPGVLGFFARRLFGSNPADEDTDEDEQFTNGAGQKELDSKGEVSPTDNGIPSKERAGDQLTTAKPSADTDQHTSPLRSEEQQFNGSDESPEATKFDSHRVQLSPGESLSYTTSPTDSTRNAPQDISHPVDLSPSQASNSNMSSFANTPAKLSTKQPTEEAGQSRWEDLDEPLTPKSLHLAMEESRARFADSDDKFNNTQEPSRDRSPFTMTSPEKKVFSGTEPVQISKPGVAPIRTKPTSPPQIASSPTHDIVDDLLGAVVHSHLTKDSQPSSTKLPPQHALNRGQEKLAVQPGERSGELNLLSPGEAPVKVPAAPQNVPLPSRPKADLYEDSSQSSSPFLASSSAFPAGGSPPRDRAAEVRPAHFIDRNQERMQMFVGKVPGQFDVQSAAGEDYSFTSPSEDLESKPPLSAPVDKTASLTAELPAAYGQSGFEGKRGQAGANSADLDAAERGSSPTATDAPSSSRKRLREPEGPFAVTGPPSSITKTSEAILPPESKPKLMSSSLDSSPNSRELQGLKGPSTGSKQEGLDLDTPSAAETRVASGEPVGDPSGATPSLTPSNAQIAEARSLAGGKVDPVTGHSTLNANQIGLPRSSGDLIDAAVEDTNISAPQPVGGFSSSIAVKPTSGNSTDLNKIIGETLSRRSETDLAAMHDGKDAVQEADELLTPTALAASLRGPSAFDRFSEETPYDDNDPQTEETAPPSRLEEQVPLEMVKREATQASAAPAIDDIIESKAPETAPIPSTLNKGDTNKEAKAALNAPTTEPEDLTAEPAPSDATKKVFGSKYGKELSQLQPEGEWGSKDTSRPGKSLDERFDGAWRSRSRSRSPEQQTLQQSGGANLFNAPTNTGGSNKVADQFAGPGGSARYMEQTNPQSSGSAQEALQDSGHQQNPTDPALPPIRGTGDQGFSVPTGSEVPQASRDSIHNSESRAPASGYSDAPPNQAAEPFSGFPDPGPGLSSQRSKDVNLARPREELPSVNVNSSAGGQPPLGQSALPKSSTGSHFETATPKSAAGFQPTSIDSPMPSMDGGFAETQQPPTEGRYVDYAAENARKLAAGLGLGSVFDSLQSGSQRLKTSMGLPAQTEPATFRSEPSDLPGFSRDALFPPAGIRETDISQDSPEGETTAAQHPHGGGSDADKAAQNMRGAFAEATNGTKPSIHPKGFGAGGSAPGLTGTAASQAAAPGQGIHHEPTPPAAATDSSAARAVGPGHGLSQQGQEIRPVQTANPAASLRDFLGHPPSGASRAAALEQLPGGQRELKSHPIDEDYPTTAGGPSATAGQSQPPSTEFEKPPTHIGMPAFGGSEAPESQNTSPANSNALITLAQGIGQSPVTSQEPKTREAGHTAPIAEEAETETKFADEKAEVTNPSAQYEGATLSPRHRPPHAYKAKDGKTPVFRPPPTSQYEETTLQAPEYDIAPAATSDRDAHPEAATEFEAIPPDLAAYEADHSQPSIEYGTTYPKSMGYETEPSTAKIESHRPATAEYETADVPSTGHGETHQPLTDASQSDVMYEEETPIQPSIRGSGLHPLLSEEATVKDQVKAAKAAEFDHEVQAGLDDIEPEPHAAEIKTAAPSAPTAAKAEAVDTPFSPSSDPTPVQKAHPTAPVFSPPPSKEVGKVERPREDMRVQSTGSGSLDAIIDREASEGDNIRDSAQHARPSSNLPSSQVSEHMMGPGPEESALGQPCTESKGKSKKLPPCVDDDEDEEEEAAKEESTNLTTRGETGGTQTPPRSSPETRRFTDEKVESPKAVTKAPGAKLEYKASAPPESDKTAATDKELGLENEKSAVPETHQGPSLQKARTPPASPFADEPSSVGAGQVASQPVTEEKQDASLTSDGRNALTANGQKAKGKKTGRRSCGCFGPGKTIE